MPFETFPGHSVPLLFDRAQGGSCSEKVLRKLLTRESRASSPLLLLSLRETSRQELNSSASPAGPLRPLAPCVGTGQLLQCGRGAPGTTCGKAPIWLFDTAFGRAVFAGLG